MAKVGSVLTHLAPCQRDPDDHRCSGRLSCSGSQTRHWSTTNAENITCERTGFPASTRPGMSSFGTYSLSSRLSVSFLDTRRLDFFLFLPRFSALSLPPGTSRFGLAGFGAAASGSGTRGASGRTGATPFTSAARSPTCTGAIPAAPYPCTHWSLKSTNHEKPIVIFHAPVLRHWPWTRLMMTSRYRPAPSRCLNPNLTPRRLPHPTPCP